MWFRCFWALLPLLQVVPRAIELFLSEGFEGEGEGAGEEDEGYEMGDEGDEDDEYPSLHEKTDKGAQGGGAEGGGAEGLKSEAVQRRIRYAMGFHCDVSCSSFCAPFRCWV